MNEAQFCGIIKNSFPKDWIFKIPDPSGDFAMTVKRAFDGIGMIQKEDGIHFLCWEAKYLSKAGAFNFQRIELHQDFFLRQFRHAMGVISYVIVGIDFGRADKRVFIFDWDEDFGKLYTEGFSIHKKILEKLPYNKVTKQAFEVKNIIDYKTLMSFYPERSLNTSDTTKVTS